MAAEIYALDLWTLLVDNVFGNLTMAVAGITLLIFVILALLGRVSIYATTLYCLMFLFAMGIGYAVPIINLGITLFLLISTILSWKSYVDSKS